MVKLLCRLGGAREANDFEKPAALVDAGIGLVALQVTGEPRADRACTREQNQSPIEKVTVAVEKRFLIAVDIGGGSRMRRDRGVLVGVGRFDPGGIGDTGRNSLTRTKQAAREIRDGLLGERFTRNDVMRKADGFHGLFRAQRRAAERAFANFRCLINWSTGRDGVGGINREELRHAKAGGGGNRIQRHTGADGTGGEKGIRFGVANGVGGLTHGKLQDFDLVGRNTILREDQIE